MEEIKRFELDLEKLAEYRDLIDSDFGWIELNLHEIGELYNVLGNERETLRAISRTLDFASLYTDIDKAGDWSLIKQIVINELHLDRLHIKLKKISNELSDKDDCRLISELTKLINNLQNQINTMIKSLGANRQERRKDTRENVQLFGGDLIEKMKVLKNRSSESSNLIEEFEDKVASTEGKRLTTSGN